MLNNSNSFAQLQDYLDNKLTPQEIEKFEKKLFRNPSQLNFVLTAKKDIKLMESRPLEKTPTALFNQVLLSKNISKQPKQLYPIKQLFIRLVENGFQVIENSFSINPPLQEALAIRSLDFSREKLVFSSDELDITFLQINQDTVSIEILFHIDVVLDYISLYLITEDGKRLINSKKVMSYRIRFENLEINNDYIISYNSKEINIRLSS